MMNLLCKFFMMVILLSSVSAYARNCYIIFHNANGGTSTHSFTPGSTFTEAGGIERTCGENGSWSIMRGGAGVNELKVALKVGETPQQVIATRLKVGVQRSQSNGIKDISIEQRTLNRKKVGIQDIRSTAQ